MNSCGLPGDAETNEMTDAPRAAIAGVLGRHDPDEVVDDDP